MPFVGCGVWASGLEIQALGWQGFWVKVGGPTRASEVHELSMRVYWVAGGVSWSGLEVFERTCRIQNLGFRDSGLELNLSDVGF